MANFKKILLVLIVGFSLNLFGCNKTTQKSKKFDATPAINYVNKYGLIENKNSWKESLQDTDQGTKISSIDQLSKILSRSNKHASAFESKSHIHKATPTITSSKNLKIINVPSVFPENYHDFKKYMNKLSQLSKQIPFSQPVIINLANNYGGEYGEMIGGLSAFIPNGKLWTEIDKNGKKYALTKTKTKIKGGWHNEVDLPIVKNPYNSQRKVIVIMNEHTASAAEILIIALKNNPNVITVGRSSAGYTTSNGGKAFGRNKEYDFVYPVTYFKLNKKLNNKYIFNNQSIQPDIVTMYKPLNDYHSIKQEPLDQDFLEEMNEKVAHYEK